MFYDEQDANVGSQEYNGLPGWSLATRSSQRKHTMHVSDLIEMLMKDTQECKKCNLRKAFWSFAMTD